MQGILIVSFGTSYNETREKNITSIENQVKEIEGEYKVYSAFTSNMIRKKLAKLGENINDVAQALAQMKEDKIDNVYILPTHLLYGYEYEKIESQVKEFESQFESIKIATPLLGDTKDMIDVVNIISNQNPVEQNQAIVLMGHGSEHFANCVYPALDYIAKQQNHPHMFITTVEGYPDIQVVINHLKNTDYRKILLLPLMLVAGDHAINDMASDEEDSLKTILTQAGYEVSTLIKGLGEYPEIRDLYITHLKSIL